jgi:hypothetical protein
LGPAKGLWSEIMSTPDRHAHWEGVYTSKADNEVSWYQETPDVSLGLIQRTGLGADAAIIDIGAGASRLIEALLDRGFRSVSALDLPSPLSKRRGPVSVPARMPSSGSYRT